MDKSFSNLAPYLRKTLSGVARVGACGAKTAVPFATSTLFLLFFYLLSSCRRCTLDELILSLRHSNRPIL